MQPKRKILLVSPLPELHYDALLRTSGFEVTTAASLEDAMTRWRPFEFSLVLVVVSGELDEYLKFCDGLKHMDPDQHVAFVTGWHTYVPPDNCPDKTIPQDHNPALFLRRVSDIASVR